MSFKEIKMCVNKSKSGVVDVYERGVIVSQMSKGRATMER